MHSRATARPVRCALALGVTFALAACQSGGSSADPIPSAGVPPTGSPTSSAPPSSSAPSSSAPSSSAPSSAPSSGASPRPRPAGDPVVVGAVASGLEVPWAIAFLPDGDALVSERDRGRIVRVGRGGAVRPVGEVPGVDAGGEGGLLGLAVSPTFASDRLVFAYLTAADDNRVVRMRYDASGRLSAPLPIVSGIRKAAVHNGGRIGFGPDGFLYIATGDAGDRDLAQDRESYNGKVLRVRLDGSPAPGNPFGGSPVWTYGHRNVQGLGWDSRGRLWASEFGQQDWDELNLLRAGRNYGWPEVEGPAEDNRFEPPQASWRVDENSPSGLAVLGDAVFMAGLKGARLWKIPVDGPRAGRPRDFLRDTYGRLRSVAVAPDGSLWVGTSNRDGRGDPRDGDDKILRVVVR